MLAHLIAMNPPTSEHRICRFGLYEADLDAGILKRHGIPVKLQEQPFRILGFLLERLGRHAEAAEAMIDYLTNFGTDPNNANLALEISHYGYVLETGRIILQNESAALRQDPKVKSAYLGG